MKLRVLLAALLALTLGNLAFAQVLINCAPSTPCNQITGPAGTGTGDPAWKAFGKDNANSTAEYAWSINCIAPLTGCGVVSASPTIQLTTIPASLGGDGVANSNTATETRAGPVNFGTSSYTATGAYSVTDAYSGSTTVTHPQGAYNAGYLDLPVNAQSSPYTLALSDVGKVVLNTSTSANTITIPANGSVAFPVKSCIVIGNTYNGGALTLQVTSDTLYWSQTGTTALTGSRTIANYGFATICKLYGPTLWSLITAIGVQ